MFVYNGNKAQLNLATSLANSYELLNYVYGEILRAPKYDYSDAPNTYVAKKYYEFMRACDITIKVYYPKNRWSSAMGYFSESNPRVININGYKLKSLDLERLVSLFYHESAHAWNATDEKYNVHHGSNNPTGKENTMMYSINRYVYKFLNYEYKPKTYNPWWLRLIRWFYV